MCVCNQFSLEVFSTSVPNSAIVPTSLIKKLCYFCFIHIIKPVIVLLNYDSSVFEVFNLHLNCSSTIACLGANPDGKSRLNQWLFSENASFGSVLYQSSDHVIFFGIDTS